MAYCTTCRRSDRPVMMGEMANSAANNGAFDTSLGLGRTSCTSHCKCDHRKGEKDFHAAPSRINFLNNPAVRTFVPEHFRSGDFFSAE
jgi:hypothetical protein